MSTPTSDTPILRVEGLAKSFDLAPSLMTRLTGRGPRRVLKAVAGVDFAVAEGETLGLVGESGCGKSTIARMIVGLEPPTAGRVLFRGDDLARPGERRRLWRRGDRIQMIFQDPFASLNPRWRVGEIVGEAFAAIGETTSAASTRDRVVALLEQVGMPADAVHRFPHEFSGGQRQRVSIARAIACDAKVLVCDEPTSALDVSVQAQILNLLKDLQAAHGLSYVLITHNLAVVRHMSHQVGVMYLGRLVEIRAADALFARPLHPYTRLLMETVPRLDTGRVRAEVAGGEVPDPVDPPKGCSFHPRCPLAADRCRTVSPEAIAVPGGRVACHAVEEGRIA
jgi:peptide/nickel transport system ATP-binding protein